MCAKPMIDKFITFFMNAHVLASASWGRDEMAAEDIFDIFSWMEIIVFWW